VTLSDSVIVLVYAKAVSQKPDLHCHNPPTLVRAAAGDARRTVHRLRRFLMFRRRSWARKYIAMIVYEL